VPDIVHQEDTKKRHGTARPSRKTSNIEPAISSEVQFIPIVKGSSRIEDKTRNKSVHRHSRTESELQKAASMHWIPDPKHNTNDLQNYLTEFKDIHQTFSSVISSPSLKSPSEKVFETFEGKNLDKSKVESRNAKDTEMLNQALESHHNSNKIFSSWRRQKSSVNSKHYIT
jgi:hypothetical protein